MRRCLQPPHGGSRLLCQAPRLMERPRDRGRQRNGEYSEWIQTVARHVPEILWLQRPQAALGGNTTGILAWSPRCGAPGSHGTANIARHAALWPCRLLWYPRGWVQDPLPVFNRRVDFLQVWIFVPPGPRLWHQEERDIMQSLQQAWPPGQSVLLRLAGETESSAKPGRGQAQANLSGHGPGSRATGCMGKPSKAQCLTHKRIVHLSYLSRHQRCHSDLSGPGPAGKRPTNQTLTHQIRKCKQGPNANERNGPNHPQHIRLLSQHKGRDHPNHPQRDHRWAGPPKGTGRDTKQFPAPIFIVSESWYANMCESLIKDNPDVLTEDLPKGSMDTGCISMRIHLPGEKTPFRISTARQIPLHWREKAERIVKKLLNGRVITPQDDRTEWFVPGFFVAKKNGDLHLIIDYTRLNKYVRRPIHTFPSTQEILSGIDPDSTVFAKLNANQGYHQVPLDEDSSRLTTFLLPSGRFRFLRAPIGLSWSSDEFCRRSDKIVKGLPGMRKLVDDILVQAQDSTTLHDRINRLLELCKSHNFTLSRKKLEIGEAFRLCRPDREPQRAPGLLTGDKGLPSPKDSHGTAQLPRMVNQLSTYHPGIARHACVLQTLLKKDTSFLWMEDHQAAFDKLKLDLLSAMTVNHFNPVIGVHDSLQTLPGYTD